MIFTLKRVETNENGVFGKLFDENGNEIAATIEHKFPGGPIIPVGEYSCIRKMSLHFEMELFCLENVPGHYFVEIHPGNTQADSRGCILLGEKRANDTIVNSRVTFKKFMDLCNGLDKITLKVE